MLNPIIPLRRTLVSFWSGARNARDPSVLRDTFQALREFVLPFDVPHHRVRALCLRPSEVASIPLCLAKTAEVQQALKANSNMEY